MAISTVCFAGAHERQRITERVSKRKAVGRQERERLWAVTQSCDLEETFVRKGLFVFSLDS